MAAPTATPAVTANAARASAITVCFFIGCLLMVASIIGPACFEGIKAVLRSCYEPAGSRNR